MFTDLNGNLCVLTHVRYKIISNYSQTTLHNISTGKRITSPYNYYDNLADDYYGADRIHYLELANEILSKETIALKGISDMLKYGTHSGEGAFVSANKLNIL